MRSHRFCPACGKPLNKGLTHCPNCGEPIIYESMDHSRGITSPKGTIIPRTTQTAEKTKPFKYKLGFFSWILLLLGGVIGLYALFTPTGSIHLGDLYSWDMWMFGYNRIYDWEVGLDVFWTMNVDLLAISLFSTLVVIIGNILSIVSAGTLIVKGIHISYLAIIAPILLIGCTLFYLAGYEVLMFFATEESFWSLMNPGFAIFGQFLAAFFMVLGFFIARSSSKYSKPLEKKVQLEKEVYQEIVYNLVKKIIETKFLLENEKSQLNNELEIISLRLKGVKILKRKVESLDHKKQHFGTLNQHEYEETLKLFQQASDLSSIQQQNISKADVYLASKILEERDKNKALNYLNEISDHTTILLGDIFKKMSY